MAFRDILTARFLPTNLLVVEVAQQEGRAPPFHHLREKFNSHRHIGALAVGLEVEHFANDVKDMFAAFFRGNILLDAVGKEHDADFVVVLNGRESQRGGNFGHHIALHLVDGAEVERATDIDQQHHREFALFLEHLHVGSVEPRRHVPVDVAHVVAELVFAHLAEGHTAPFESRVILACKDVRTQASRLNLDFSNLFD